MFRICLLFPVVMVVIALDREAMMKNCGKLFHGGKACCKDDIGRGSTEHREVVKECMHSAVRPEACGPEICIATKRGFGTDEGKVIKDKVEEIFSDDFKAYPKLVAALKEKCVEGDISIYGHPDSCEVKKLMHCVNIQVLDQCSEWSNDGPCEGMEDVAKDCVSTFA